MPYFGTGEVSFTKNEFKGSLIDDNIRGDLNLTAPLPTSIKMDNTGITAYTTVSSSNFARLDYRGLYIQNGALDIRTGTSDQRGVVLNKNGLKGFKSDGALTFNLDTNGTLSLYNGGIDLYTIGTNRYRGVRLDSDGLRGYNASGTETFNLKASDGSLTLNGGYLKIINGLKADQIESSATNKWNNAESNAKSYSDLQFAQANNNMISVDGKIRADLRLVSPLPTNLLLNGDGITASTPSNPSRFARMDFRGLYVQGGAIDIRTNGNSNSRGVILDSGGLKGYDNSGKMTFNLNSSNGAAYFSGEVFVGDDNEAYTRIRDNYVQVFGKYIRTWGVSDVTLSRIKYLMQYDPTNYELNQYRQRVTLELKEGRMRINNPNNGSLYYSDYGISTWAEGTGSETSSGVIEFFSRKYGSVNGLSMYSSGNISLNSTYRDGSTIYLNAMGGNSSSSASVIIGYGDSPSRWGTLKAGRIFVSDEYNNSWEVASKQYVREYVSDNMSSIDTSSFVRYSALSSYVTKSSLSNGYIIGSWKVSSTNLNATTGNIKMGSATGNIVCNKLTETSAREKKKNINVYNGNATNVINRSTIKTYQYLNDVEGLDIPYIGLILDEAPLEVVDTFGNGVLPAQGTWIAWKAIQELSTDLVNEKAKNEILTEELNDLRSDVEYIKSLL